FTIPLRHHLPETILRNQLQIEQRLNEFRHVRRCGNDRASAARNTEVQFGGLPPSAEESIDESFVSGSVRAYRTKISILQSDLRGDSVLQCFLIGFPPAFSAM